MHHPISAVDTNLLFIHTEREGTTIRVQTAWRKQMGNQSLTTLRSHVFDTSKPQVSALRARWLIRQIAVSRPVFYADVGQGLADLDGVADIGQVELVRSRYNRPANLRTFGAVANRGIRDLDDDLPLNAFAALFGVDAEAPPASCAKAPRAALLLELYGRIARMAMANREAA